MADGRHGAGFLRFALRDAVVVLLCGALWWADGAELTAPLGAVVAVLAGVSTALVGFFGHEWGHLLGARLGGGTVVAPARVTSPFLFHFDVAGSSRRAFLTMSYGGFAATGVGVVVIAALVPYDRLSGQVALVATVLGVIVTFVLEVPTAVRVAAGGPLPTGFVYVDGGERGT